VKTVRAGFSESLIGVVTESEVRPSVIHIVAADGDEALAEQIPEDVPNELDIPIIHTDVTRILLHIRERRASSHQDFANTIGQIAIVASAILDLFLA
jgi:hypothetical protein